jgi:spore maturation protein SpmA
VLNWIWLFLILISVVWAAFTGQMSAVSLALFEGAKSAVGVVIGLVGVMVFMLGIMRVAFDGGLREWIARALAPLLVRIFPEIPPNHPAMSALVMNMASNMLGMGNAATPFGLKAMVEMDKLNPHPGSASNAMVLFLAINTSAITILPPAGTMGVRLAAGSTDPAAIWIPTLIATTFSTIAAVGVFYLLRSLPMFRHQPALGPLPQRIGSDDVPFSDETSADDEAPATTERPREPMGAARLATIIGTCALIGIGLWTETSRLAAETGYGDAIKQIANVWPFPLLIVGMLLIGVAGRVPIYDSMIEGAREGLQVAVRIVPYLVAILAAVAMLRASGFLDSLIGFLNPLTSRLGVPADVLPMALMRPLSGSGALGIMTETLETHGPDSFIGNLTSTLMGSTETTFYVLAVYFGAARITDGRHTIFACLTGDVAGFVGATLACHYFFG